MIDLAYRIARVVPIGVFFIIGIVLVNGLINTNNVFRELFLASWLEVAAAALAFVGKHMDSRS